VACRCFAQNVGERLAIWIPVQLATVLATPVLSAVTLLSRQLRKNAEKPRTKGEYGREVDSRASSQLLDSPPETPAPANYHKVTLGAVNRRVASSNLAREPNLFSLNQLRVWESIRLSSEASVVRREIRSASWCCLRTFSTRGKVNSERASRGGTDG